MPTAAIYARKSTEQNVSDDAKSITRQVELARAFAKSRGWTVAPDHVYTDDGISGAEFVKRPGLNALLSAIRSRPCPVQTLVTMEVSRLGREQTETALIVREILRAGVRIFTYADGREITLDSALDKFSLNALNFVSEMERELSRTRTREAMRAKARNGYVAGGKVYGYTNVRQGSNSVRQVNETEAAVVRRIFELTTQGHGLLKIIKRLNAEGVPSPRGDGWATTAIREMLRRDLYRGLVVYGRTRWVDRGGTKVKVAMSESEWLIREEPALRIVPEELWRVAHARIERTRRTHAGHRQPTGQLNGRPESGLVSRHLLSGFLRCGICNGNLSVLSRSGKRGKPGLYYVCTTHHKRGTTRCTNRWGVPYQALTDAVLRTFRTDFLHPEVLGCLLMKEWEDRRRDPEEALAERKAVEGQVRQLDRELARLTEAITAGAGDVKTVVEALQSKQRQRNDLAARLEHLEGLAQADEFDLNIWFEQTRELLTDLQTTLETDPAAGRGVMRGLLVSTLTVTPKDDGKWFEYVGQGALDRVLAGRLPGAASQKNHATVLVPPGRSSRDRTLTVQGMIRAA